MWTMPGEPECPTSFRAASRVGMAVHRPTAIYQRQQLTSVLATFYISSIPNFILLAVPADLEPSSLNTMIAFATGGLLGDVFLHLVPHAFFGEQHSGAVVVEEKRNIVIG